jgi:hypothetical protein
MTYGWNRGPENPRRSGAELGDRADDPDLLSMDGDPDGLGGGDPAWAHQSDPAAGPGHTPGRAGGLGGHGTRGNADTWISRDTGASAVTSSHWQPGYEPLGHRPPGGTHVGDAPPSAIQRSAIQRDDARHGDALQGAAWQGAAWQGAAWQGDARQGDARQGDARQSGAWSGGNWLGQTSPGAVPRAQPPAHPPYQSPGYAPERFHTDDEASGGQDPAASGYRPPGHPPGGLPQTQGYRSLAALQTGAPADSTGDEPAGYQRPGYQRPGYQPQGAADVVSYGYTTDPAKAAYQQRSESSAGEASALTHPDSAREPGWLDHPDWVRVPEAGGPEAGGPEAGGPEFVLHGPAGSEPRAPAGRSYRDGEPRRAMRRGRRSRVWLGVGVLLVIVVAAAAVFYGKLGRSSQAARPPAPSHALAAPQAIGAYSRDQQAEQVLDLSHNEQYVTQIAPGHVWGIVAAVYDTGGPASSPDRVAIIAGRLVNSPPADVIKSFMQQEAAEGNAPMAVPAGPLGGQAACAGKGKSGICLWADASTVGVVVSATINQSSLAPEMLTIRSGVEVPAA